MVVLGYGLQPLFRQQKMLELQSDMKMDERNKNLLFCGWPLCRITVIVPEFDSRDWENP
jgi:hypothetical protein